MPQDIPKPKQGDLILFSADVETFRNPSIGWVTSDRDELVVNALVFTPTGFVEKTGVHYRHDPRLPEMPGWASLGCWDYAPSTKRYHQAESVNGEAKQPARK